MTAAHVYTLTSVWMTLWASGVVWHWAKRSVMA